MTKKEKIIKYLDRKGIKHTKLAEKMGENRQFVSYHFRKKTDINYELFLQMLEVLEINESQLNEFVVNDKTVQYNIPILKELEEKLNFLMKENIDIKMKLAKVEHEKEVFIKENEELRQLLLKGGISFGKFESKIK